MDTPDMGTTETKSDNGMNAGGSMPMSDKSKNTLMAILAYIGPLVIVSFLVDKETPFVKFHIKQGLVLFVIEIVIWFLSSMLWSLWMIWQLVNIIVVIFSVLGIVNAAQGKEKELPFIGQFSKHFPI